MLSVVWNIFAIRRLNVERLAKVASWFLWLLWIPLGLLVAHTNLDDGVKFALVFVSVTAALGSGLIDAALYYNKRNSNAAKQS